MITVGLLIKDASFVSTFMKTTGFISLAVVLFTMVCVSVSCNNDLDIIAPYKDTTIVYALLHQSDKIHYVRIHKSFIGEGDAYAMAQHADSFYHKNVLSVKLERWKFNKLYGVINFTRDSSLTKDTGIFANTPNIIYRSDTCSLLADDSQYRLVIRNAENGSEVSAVTQMISPATIINPTSGTVNFNPGPFVIRIGTGKYGKQYNIRARFNYVEENKNLPQVYVNKSVTWNIATVTATTTAGQEIIQYNVSPDEFYNFCAASIPVDNNIIRYSGKLDFYFTATDETMFEYLRINNANGINSANALLFSNIKNGLGVFGCQRTDESVSKTMNGSSIAYLVSGPLTSKLGFVQ